MLTAALISLKAASAKTTLAANLAVAAERTGVRAVIYDLDVKHAHCATNWARARARTADRPVVRPQLAARIDKAVELARADTQLCLIDTGRRDVAPLRLAARAADLVLVPFGAPVYLHEIVPSLELAREAGTPAWAVMLRPRTPNLGDHTAALDAAAADAIHTCQANGINVAPVAISNVPSFRDATVRGLGVQEYGPGSEAADQIEALHAWVRHTGQSLATADPAPAPATNADSNA